MSRKIVVQESDEKLLPTGMRWKKKGGYSIRWSRHHIATNWADGNSSCDNLTQARKEARALVREGAAWAEVHRWAENGTTSRGVFICSYEVEEESGSAIK